MNLGFTISVNIVIFSFVLLVILGFSWHFVKDAKKINKILYICLTVLGAISLVVSIPYLINESYKQNIGYMTVWEGKDLLAFYGSVLSFVGTISLGALALWQNLQLKNKDVKEKRKDIAIENCPVFMFEDRIDYYYYDDADSTPKANQITPINNNLIPVADFNGNKIIWQTHSSQAREWLNIEFCVKNIGNTLATGIYVETAVVKSREKCNVLDEKKTPIKYILPGNKGIILINIPMPELRSSKKMEYLVTYSNPFGSQYTQSIIFMLNYKDKIIEIQTTFDVQIKEEIYNDKNNFKW